MITKKELTGNKLKKSLNAFSVAMRWHNKNKYISNFGFNIYFDKEFNRATDTELTGDYNAETGELIELRYGYLYQCGVKIDLEKINTYDLLIEQLKEFQNQIIKNAIVDNLN